MEQISQDIRYGIRTLLRSPGVAVAAVVALALGIGATTAIFSVVNGVLLKPLPYPQPDRLARVWESNTKKGFLENPASPANFADWRGQNESFEALAAYFSWSPNLMGEHEPERLRGSLVSWNLFQLLGVELRQGRSFLPEEDRPGTGDAVILSYSLYRRLFGDGQDAIGEALTLSGNSYTVVGVAPAGFEFPNQSRIWAPLSLTENMLELRGGRFLQVVGRIKPDATLRQARSEMEMLAARLEQEHPKSNAGWGVRLQPMHEDVVGEARPALLVLSGAVFFVLLIACANVANLLLARATSRRSEMAIRASMGASRTRLIGQFLTESLIIAAVGGALGTLGAYGFIRWLAATGPEELPRLEQVGLDWQVFAFVVFASLATALISGLIPAMRAANPNLNETLKEGGRGSGRGGQRFHRLLVVGEVSLALILLIGAGLMIKSFSRLMSVDTGFNPDNVLSMRISLPGYKYSEPQRQLSFYDALLEQVNGLPEVRSAGLISYLPLSGSSMGWIFAVQGVPVAEDQRPQAQYRQISPGYFETMGIGLLQGREFDDRDLGGQRGVIIVNEAFAERFLKEGNPLGQRVGFGRDPDWREVVGVVENVRHFGPDSEARPEAYVPYKQDPWQSMALVVRTSGEPAALAGAVRHQVRQVDPDQPVFDVRSMRERVSESVASQRLAMLLMSGFGAVALILAVVGIYGVMAYSVNRRTREIGLRMALGADQRDVLGLVVWQGLRLALIAVAAGLAGAFALSRFLSSLLFDVTTTDLAVFAGIPALLILVSLLACFIPAARASRVDPLEALRLE